LATEKRTPLRGLRRDFVNYKRTLKMDPTQLSNMGKEPRVETSWGWYQVVYKGDGVLGKILHVEPGKCLSLQKHFNRKENWLVTRGVGCVLLGETPQQLKYEALNEGARNNTALIPQGWWHKLINFSEHKPLVIYEVQEGEILSEDDIQRFGDASNS